ncbi:MAG: PTS sugar transporter subunit IIA [Clostridia bacterium]|nr:PTS sugar transporter subunit IIA [Clostridia bacterium]
MNKPNVSVHSFIIKEGSLVRIGDYLTEKGIALGLSATEKGEVLEWLIALQRHCGNVVLQEEVHGLTAIGAGVAIGKVTAKPNVHPCITAVTLEDGIDLDAHDGEKSRLIFLVAIPFEKEELSARLTVLLMNEELRERLIISEDTAEFLRLVQLVEGGAVLESEEQKRVRLPPAFLLLVSGCILVVLGRGLGLWLADASRVIQMIGDAVLGIFCVLFSATAAYKLLGRRGALAGAAFVSVVVILCGGTISCVVLLWIALFCTHKVK